MPRDPSRNDRTPRKPSRGAGKSIAVGRSASGRRSVPVARQSSRSVGTVGRAAVERVVPWSSASSRGESARSAGRESSRPGSSGRVPPGAEPSRRDRADRKARRAKRSVGQQSRQGAAGSAQRADPTKAVRRAPARADQRLGGSPPIPDAADDPSPGSRGARGPAQLVEAERRDRRRPPGRGRPVPRRRPASGARSRAGGPRPSRPDRCGARGGRHRGLPRAAMGRGAQRAARGTTDHRRSAQSRRDRRHRTSARASGAGAAHAGRSGCRSAGCRDSSRVAHRGRRSAA